MKKYAKAKKDSQKMLVKNLKTGSNAGYLIKLSW
jgi:hypothetical protein